MIGLSSILYAFKTSPHELIERLRGNDPALVLAEIRTAMGASKNSARTAALVMLEAANKGRRSGRFDSNQILLATEDMRTKGAGIKGRADIRARPITRPRRHG